MFWQWLRNKFKESALGGVADAMAELDEQQDLPAALASFRARVPPVLTADRSSPPAGDDEVQVSGKKKAKAAA